MSILEKLGIDRKTVYDNIVSERWPTYKDYRYVIWHFWKLYVWPTYSQMLIKMIYTAEDYEFRSCQDDYTKIIKEITGLTWQEISELLKDL